MSKTGSTSSGNTSATTENRSDDNNENNNTSLSRYLHGVFQPILDHDQPANLKINSISRVNDFLSGSSTASTPPKSKLKNDNPNNNDNATDEHEHEHILRDNLFSPLVSDVHLSIHPNDSSTTSKYGSKSRTPVTSKSTSSSNSASNVVGIQSGIQLPVIEWHREFRKGYSLLMWVCLHDDSIGSGSNDNKTNSSSNVNVNSDNDVDNDQSDPQILFRFATSASPMAHGVQATIHKDTTASSGGNNIPVKIKIETLRPNHSHPSSHSHSHSHANSPMQTPLPASPTAATSLPTILTTTKPILIPNKQWTLICIQHSFPYLKRPVLCISVNGTEVERNEIVYPTIGGGEVGEVMMDNYLLCNIPTSSRRKSSKNSKSSRVIGKSVHLNNISQVDFAGFGLFKEPIPTLLQAIICEHGPCPTADGVIPAVPPVVQCRDGIVISAGNRGTMSMTMTSSSSTHGGGHSTHGGGASPKKSSVVSSGPFSLSSHRSTNVSEGRGIGIPLCTGVQLTEDVSHKGELFLQQLLSKLVIGLNGSGVFQLDDSGRIGIQVNGGCTIGQTADVKMIGIVQAKVPNKKTGEGRRSQDSIPTFGDPNGNIARGIGNISVYHATKEFLALEKEEKVFEKNNDSDSMDIIPLPSYELPKSNIAPLNPMPGFLSTYLSIDSISYILQPFHLALPPPGYTHNLQMNLYHDSFDHLYDLVVYNDGALAAKLIELLVTNLYLGGRIREEMIHRGGIHSLIVLLRRVLLRAGRLGIMSCKAKKQANKRLWEIYAPQESYTDELQDINGQKESAPSYIPAKITKACQSLITACCGPAVEIGRRWKRPPLAVHVRRTSDIALTAIFGLALDLDLWGGDPIAAATIMEQFADLYCTDGYEYQVDPPELTEKFDSGYGRLLRGQISVQHLLDMTRLRFGNEIITQERTDNPEKVAALTSLAKSLSRIFYVLLKYSLFKQISQGEHDISAIVAALSDCSLGSVGAHIVLSALKDILIYCEVLPNRTIGSPSTNSDEEDISQPELIKTLLEGSALNSAQSGRVEQSMKLKRVKSEIAGRLARNLLMGQFHDVVAPMLLSRTVFDGRKTVIENSTSKTKDQKQPQTVDDLENEIPVSFEWQSHWITTLHIFIWLASVARSEGDKVAHTTGNLLLQSGQAGSLAGCLLHLNNLDFVSLLAPPLPTPYSALTPGGISGKDAHLFDTYNRLRIIHQLMGGLVASLVSNYSDSGRDEDRANKQKRPKLLLKSAISSLDYFVNVLVSMILYVQDKEIDPQNDSRRRRNVNSNSTLEKVPVRTAIGSVPSLVLVSVLLENPIQEFKKEYNSDGSWDFVEDDESSSIRGRKVLEEQLRILTSCQTSLLQTAALLIAKAMVVGGGEATTIILRDVVCNLTSVESNDLAHDDTEQSHGCSTTKIKNHLLCRLISMVLVKVVTRNHKQDDPWKSVELCSATARLCDLVEEKKLLQCQPMDDSDECNDKLSLDQVRLLCALLDVMEAGRENTGWCQIVMNDTTHDANRSRDVASPSKKEKSSLVQILTSPERKKTAKHVDYDMLARNDEIYHLIRNDNDASFEIFDMYRSSQASTNPQSFSTSKLLLPILQPSLRIVLGCLGEIRSAAIIQYTSGNGGKSLLSILVEELRSTMTAALVGLAFPHARDLCLSALSLLRQGIEHHEQSGDEFVAAMYRDIFVTVVEEISVRYESERKKREVAELFSYDTKAPSPEVANSHEVEKLLLGNTLVSGSNIPQDEVIGGSRPADTSDDFIIFPGNGQSSTPMGTSMGWNGYKGFGIAIDKCMQPSNVSHDDKAKLALSILSSYLDTWDEKQIMDDEESELVELFDTNASTASAQDSFPSSGFATAADSMTSYIELASVESNRISEIQTFLLPYKRYNCLSFAETLCWKSFLEFFVDNKYGIELFERCVADAGRDYGGRLLTVPIHPQFARSIPSQLDHSLQLPTADSKDDDPNNTSVACLSMDLDELNTLVQQGNLKILDITKKGEDGDEENNTIPDDVSDESDNVLVSKPSMESVEEETQSISENRVEEEEEEEKEDKEDLYLGFPERSEDNELINGDKNEVQKEDISLSVRSGIEQDCLDDEGHSSIHTFFMSSFANPPNSTSSSLQGHLHHGIRDGSTVTGWGGLVEDYYDNCVHVKPEGNRKGTLLLTPTYLIFEYDDPSGLTESEVLAIEEMKKKSTDADSPEVETNDYDSIIQHYMKTAALRPKSMRWNIHELSHIYLRRYRLRDSALELFFIPSGGSMSGGTGLLSALSSIWLDFGAGNEGNIRRDDAANAIMKRAPPSTVKQWPDKSAQFLHEHLRNITLGWVKGRINNFDYLLALNILSGRSFNDLCQYPVFPWVLSNFTSEEIPDLTDESNFRDLTKPMGALNPQRLEEFIERFQSFDDIVIPPFMYGSHYSTSAGVVLHFLVRMHPFASLHRQLQGGHFDVADRLFSSVSRTWDMCTGQSAAEVKELTPEWYCNPSFLKNTNGFKLGTSQDGESLGDVILPPWAQGSPEKFVEVQRCALESDICTKMLPNWIDLIFGRKQQGPASVEAHNVFFYLTYYGSCDVASIEDDDLRIATELQIAHFGQCPMQLFWRPHVSKLSKTSKRRRMTLSELLRLYDIQSNSVQTNTEDLQLIFGSAPLEYWLHLSSPPPGPHAPIIAVRLVAPDRCLAVDAQGIFHFFRFGWKPQVDTTNNDQDETVTDDLFTDKGVFVAQRELPHFRSVPRLHYTTPKKTNKITSGQQHNSAVVAISKCIFNRSLLVISDGDGSGALCLQFVNPTKGIVEGQVLVPSVHSSRVSALHTDPIGAAVGVGGAGGELAIVGSEDGTATLWRFISNPVCTLPLRPRLRFGGHKGMKINAVAVSSALHICVTVSASRCCVFGLSNGAMLSSISPSNIKFPELHGLDGDIRTKSFFANANAVCISASGFITLVCTTQYFSSNNKLLREVVSLALLTLEGVHIVSKPLESWRGIPHKIVPTYDGRGIMVCSGGGVSIHLVSAIKPLHFVDEWKVANDDEIYSGIGAYDIDFGPSLSRPVVAVTGLSAGAIRIHAFKGVSEWSEEVNKRSSMSEAVGNALARPAEKMKGLFGVVKGKGSKVVGLSKEIGREAVSGFLGDVFGKKMEM